MVEDRRQAVCLALTIGIAKDCVVLTFFVYSFKC